MTYPKLTKYANDLLDAGDCYIMTDDSRIAFKKTEAYCMHVLHEFSQRNIDIRITGHTVMGRGAKYIKCDQNPNWHWDSDREINNPLIKLTQEQ